MTFAKRSLHTILTVTGTLALFGGLLVVTTSPGSAATTATFTQPDGIFGGGGGTSFAVDSPVSVPGATTQGPAAPYGSELVVPYHSRVNTVRVEIIMTHAAPDDLDLLLVGPGGQQALFMSDAGGGTDVSNLRFLIDDGAANPLPDTAAFTNGATYGPANYNDGQPDSFPAPAPGLTGNTSLGVFAGTIAAGTWRLYAMDDAVFDIGTIAYWGLTFDLEPAPHPSVLDVGGLPPISDVDVTLHGFTSTYPKDMDILLVGPGGQQATVMSDAGGPTDVSDLTLTFDDEAASPPLEHGPLVSGSFQPADYELLGDDSYGMGHPTPDGNTRLSAFDGTNPNGQWRLYFFDDNVDDASTITGWSLEFSFTETQPPSGSVTIADGASTTSTRDVTLKLSATDPAPSGGGVSQMRFSNDGATFAAYQPYAATAAWTLAPGDGPKTVFAQFRDADGNESAVVKDTITLSSGLDTTGPRSVKTSPGSRAKGVKTSTRVKVKASESVKRGSVTGKTVLLKAKGSSHRVKATLAYRASAHTIVLTPRSHLKHHATYRMTVKGVRDLAGNTWDQKPGKAGVQALTFAFTTS